MMAFFDKIPVMFLITGAILLGFAPFFPEPHLVEKLRMLNNSELTKPVDIFDLLMHASLPVLLIAKLIRMALTNRKK
jgi:hypothetical protein